MEKLSSAAEAGVRVCAKPFVGQHNPPQQLAGFVLDMSTWENIKQGNTILNLQYGKHSWLPS